MEITAVTKEIAEQWLAPLEFPADFSKLSNAAKAGYIKDLVLYLDEDITHPADYNVNVKHCSVFELRTRPAELSFKGTPIFNYSEFAKAISEVSFTYNENTLEILFHHATLHRLLTRVQFTAKNITYQTGETIQIHYAGLCDPYAITRFTLLKPLTFKELLKYTSPTKDEDGGETPAEEDTVVERLIADGYVAPTGKLHYFTFCMSKTTSTSDDDYPVSDS